jgi:hypothetical protein
MAILQGLVHSRSCLLTLKLVCILLSRNDIAASMRAKHHRSVVTL